MPTLNIVYVGDTQIRYQIENLDSQDYSGVTVYLYKGRGTGTAAIQSSRSYSGTFSGLSSGTQYTVYAYAVGQYGTSDWDDTKYPKTTGTTTYTLSVTVKFFSGINGKGTQYTSRTSTGSASSTSTSGDVYVSFTDTSVPERTGYVFDHWQMYNYSSYTWDQYGGYFTGTSSGNEVEVIAIWTPVYTLSVTVRFFSGIDGKGTQYTSRTSTGSTSSTSTSGDVSVSFVDQSKPTRTGYEFVCWQMYGYESYTWNQYGGTFTGKSNGNTVDVIAIWRRVKIGATPYIWAYDSSQGRYRWHEATAYIWNGSQWKLAAPYIWDGSSWRPQ